MKKIINILKNILKIFSALLGLFIVLIGIVETPKYIIIGIGLLISIYSLSLFFKKRQKIIQYISYTIFMLLAIIHIILIPSKTEEKKEHPKPKSKMEKLNDKYHFISHCENHIKSNLNYPSTYKSGFLNKDIVYLNEDRAKVIIEYSAKNAFNLKLKYKAICTYDNKANMIDFSNNKNF